MTFRSKTTWTFDGSTRETVDAIFAEFTNSTPGCAMAIYRGGEIVYANGYGMANLEHNIPITPASIFHVASISKQFTAMCIALLQDDGLLDVDDPVQKYVPDLPEYPSPITVRHLIHHVSGIRDQWMLLRMAGWREDDIITEADCFDLIRRQKELNFTPNSEYLYSNSGYTLLAMIVKAVSGKSLREFAHERIFQPLGMNNTHFHDDHTEIVPGRTQGYQPRDGGGYFNSNPPFDVVGTTSLHTTVEDFAKWHANFDTPVIGSAALLEQAQTPGTFTNGKPMEYAWGLSIDTWLGQYRVGHDGADHGYRTSYFRLPELDFGVTVFANFSTVWPAQFAEKIAAAVLGDLLNDAEKDADNQTSDSGERQIVRMDADAIAGVYIAEDTNDGERPWQLILNERDGQAFISIWNEEIPLPLNEDGSFDFRNGFGAIWATELGDGGTVATVRLHLPHTGTKTFTRLDASGITRPIDSFAGTYYAPELDVSIQLEVNDSGDGLSWKQRKLDDRDIVMLDDSTLGMGSLAASMHLDFSFDGAGVPTEFRFSGSRLRNLPFERQ